MLRFALVASGSKGNCCLVRNEETSIVIDCGTTQKYIKASFQSLHFSYLDADALFITHTHIDHVKQLKMFHSIETYSRAFLDTDHYHHLLAHSVTQIKTMRIEEFPLSHDTNETSGFVIEDKDSKMVYVTDTGYLNQSYYGAMQDADYYIFESNHDPQMLMQTNRPLGTKRRILSDQGHMCNEVASENLSCLIGEHTSEIVLAHISQEANDPVLAKNTLIETLVRKHIPYEGLSITSAPQFAIVTSKNYPL